MEIGEVVAGRGIYDARPTTPYRSVANRAGPGGGKADAESNFAVVLAGASQEETAAVGRARGGDSAPSGLRREGADPYQAFEAVFLKQMLDQWMSGSLRGYIGASAKSNQWDGVIGEVLARALADSGAFRIASLLRTRDGLS